MITSLSVLLRMRNSSDKSYRENKKVYFTARIFFSENRAVYEIWENMVEPDMPRIRI